MFGGHSFGEAPFGGDSQFVPASVAAVLEAPAAEGRWAIVPRAASFRGVWMAPAPWLMGDCTIRERPSLRGVWRMGSRPIMEGTLAQSFVRIEDEELALLDWE